MKKLNLAFLRSPKFRYGTLSTALLCAAIAVLMALNGLFTTLEQRFGWRVDFSFNSITSHSETTEALLAELDTPVHIYALYEKSNEDAVLFELLNRYSAASPLITWEQAPLSLNPGLLTRFAGATSDNAVTEDSLVVYCAATDRFRVLDYDDLLSLTIDYEAGTYSYAGLTYESAITSAIAYVTQETIPVVYMVQGHDELDENSTAVLADFLRGNHYDLRYCTLGSIEALSPEDLLVFMAPVRDLTESELRIVTEFAAQGGSLLFACDYSDPIASMPNYRALLRSYGFLPLDGVVVANKADTATYFEGNRTLLLPQMEATETTFDLKINGTDTLILSSARAFETPETTDNSLVVTPMLLSGEGSYLRSLSSTSTSLNKQEGDPEGPFALALEAYRFSETGDVSRAIMIGSTAALTSEYYYSITHAQEFIIRMMEYLVDAAPSALGIMARAAVRPGLSADALSLGSMLLVALPLLVLAAALIILYPRRHL